MSETPLLEVRNLTVSYRHGRGRVPALRQISFTLQRGDSYGIIGESGSGKSTLAYAVMRHLGAGGRVDDGAVLFKGQDLLRASDQEIRALRGNRLAMVYQQPQAALNPSIPLGDQIAEVYTIHGAASPAEARQRMLDMLRRVRIAEPEAVARLYPHQASGGMQQRVVIAMALALRPDLILLDEPTTALDVTTQAAVLELLEDLRREFGTTIIFIAHDLAVITRICDRVAVFYAGEMLEEATLRNLFQQPRHPYTAGLMECLPARGIADTRQPLSPIPGRLPSLSALPPGCIFAPRCRYAQPNCVQGHPDLVETGPWHRARCLYWQDVRIETPAAREAGNGAEAAPAEQAPLLELDTITKSFSHRGAATLFGGSRSQVQVLGGISFAVNQGHTVGLVGESGSGKTTLARCILGLTPADGGRIRFGARDLPRHLHDRTTSMLRELQMVFQNPDMSLNPRQTIRTILTRPIRVLSRAGRREAETAARDLLRAVNLDERFMDRYPAQLSGGEKQRVAIARAFAARTRLVICDEPVSGLDVSVQATVLNLLQELQARWGTAYLFISHDLQVVQYLADRVVVLYRGHIVETGLTGQVFAGPNHPYTEVLLAAIPLPDPDAPRTRLALESESRQEATDGRGCPFKGRCHRKRGPICDTEFPPLRTIADGHVALCHIPVAELPSATSREATPAHDR
jgi:peptide/nickel transport system ATP-binding protein